MTPEDERDLFENSSRPSFSERIKLFLNSGSEFHVRLSLEKLVITGAIAAVILTGVFIAGFLRGKAVSPQSSEALSASPRTSPKTSLIKERSVSPLRTKSSDNAKSVNRVSEAKSFAKTKAKPYTIQVAAYRIKDRALTEAGELRKKGYDPYLIQRGSYVEVCVGQYANRRDAQKDIKALRVRYRDCFLRNIPS